MLIDCPSVDINSPLTKLANSATKSKRLLSSKLTLSRRSNSNNNINNANNNNGGSDTQPHNLAFNFIELLVNYLFRESNQKLNEKLYGLSNSETIDSYYI
jgi:hypothetical protein